MTDDRVGAVAVFGQHFSLYGNWRDACRASVWTG